MSDENNAQIEQTNTPTNNNEAEGQGQVQENNQSTEETGSEGDAEGDSSSKHEEQPKKDKMKGWAQQRINELTYKNNQERERAEALRKQTETLLAELAAARSKGDGDKEGLSRAEIDRLAAIKAEEIAANKVNKARSDDLAEKVWDDGTKEFPDFADSISNLNNSFGEKFGNMAPVIMEALDNPHKIMHHLGDNLDEAARIFNLSPAKQIVELTKLEAAIVNKTKPISKVPAPPKTIDGKGKTEPTLDNEKLSTAEWMRLRNQDLEKKGRRKF
jgi:hypothetical protein